MDPTPSFGQPLATTSATTLADPGPTHLRAMILSSLDNGEEKSERSLLELVLLAESRGYKQAEQVRCLSGR